MNVPGRTGGNWRWRIEEDVLADRALYRLCELTDTSKRLGSGPNIQQIELERDDSVHAVSSHFKFRIPVPDEL
jgi:hypothetical protein